MKYSVAELNFKAENIYFISPGGDCLARLKALVAGGKSAVIPVILELDAEALGLSTKLYGNTKSETKRIGKRNCKNFLKYFKLVKRAVRLAKKSGNFNGTLYVKGLSQKKNNNDLMLASMLEISEAKFSQKFTLAYEAACDFLDAENSLNKMCDFRDNRCTKHREFGTEKSTGCCASFCKLRVDGKACTHKNLACKIFMCDYLINKKGYYFTPHTLPVLKKYFTMFERAVCFGLLCRTEKKSLRFLRFVRVLTALYALVIAGLLAWLIVSVM